MLAFNKFHHLKRKLPIRFILSTFLVMIIIGTILLSLPISSKSGESESLINTLFIATSSTCVTGLSIFDTWTQWSIFGQAVILLLIQLGGLGIVSFTSGYAIFINKKLGLKDIIAVRTYTDSPVQNVKSLISTVLVVSFSCEFIGTMILCIRLIPKYGLYGIWLSLFTSISAYCNAGFDLMGIEQPGQSLIPYAHDPIINSVVMALTIIGGIGFIVILDIFLWLSSIKSKKHSHLSVHSIIVIKTTLILIFLGTILFFFIEYDNTLKLLTLPQKLLASLFQSVECRTAGFFSVPIDQEYDITKIITIMLMFIGASPSSTGGGIKTTTMAVIISTVISVLAGHTETTINKHKLNKNTVYKATAIAFSAIFLIFVSSVIINLSEIHTNISELSILFETVSAFATVGLSTGITSQLSSLSKLILCLLMFIGRVGPISLVLSIILKRTKNSDNIYPEGKIIIG